MKSKGTARKQSFINRLFKESLILSCLGIISSRLISFFKDSVFSYIFTGCEESDTAVGNGGIGKAFEKHKLKGRFTRAVKSRFALSVENSFITNWYRSLIKRLVLTPVSTFGAFFTTLGIYICLVYFVKLYGFGAESTKEITSLLTGGAIILASLPLLFCRKGLAVALSQSVFIRNMLADLIDLDSYKGERRHGAVGTALIIGSVLGVLTFFCGETKIGILIASAVYLLLVLHSPELGLLSVAAVFPFGGRWLICAAVTVTLISYILKVLRGKRNFCLHSANIFVLLLGLCFAFEAASTGSGKSWFAMCAVCVYLLASNLLTTNALLVKCVNALTTGLGVAIAVYTAQVFIVALDGGGWYTAITSSYSVFDSGRQFSCYLLLIMPFVFCKSSRTSFGNKLLNYLLVIAYIVYSVLNGDTVYAILAAAAASLCLAVQGRRIFRPFFMCFGVPVGGLYFANVPISFGDMGFYTTLSGWLGAFKASISAFFLGVGMSEQSVSLAFSGDSHSMLLQTLLECGFTGLLLLALALAFALQRVYARLSSVGSTNRNLTAAAGASSVIGLMIGACNNVWTDKDICMILWLCLGLACAAYGIRKETARGRDDEHNG